MAMTNHLLCYLVHVTVCAPRSLCRLNTFVSKQFIETIRHSYFIFFFFRTHLSNLTQVQCINADIPAQLINFYGFRPQLNGRVLLKQQF